MEELAGALLQPGVLGALQPPQEEQGLAARLLQEAVFGRQVEPLLFRRAAQRPLAAGARAALHLGGDDVLGVATGAQFRGQSHERQQFRVQRLHGTEEARGA
jgi:hypothetical protein